MLRKVNWGLCIFSVVLAVLQILGMFLDSMLLPAAALYVVVPGVALAAVLWFVAQWKCDDSAVRAATIALGVFVLCLGLCFIQMFLLLGTLL